MSIVVSVLLNLFVSYQFVVFLLSDSLFDSFSDFLFGSLSDSLSDSLIYSFSDSWINALVDCLVDTLLISSIGSSSCICMISSLQ